MSYGDGLNQIVRAGIESMGDDLMIAWSGGWTSEQPGGMRAGRRVRFTVEDAEVIKRTAPLVAAISPELFRDGLTVVWGNREIAYSVRGVWPEYAEIRNMALESGRWITPRDDVDRKRVAVIGGTVGWELFRGVPPVGNTITINGLPFHIIGLLQGKGEMQPLYSSDNLSIFLPYNTMSWFGEIRYPIHLVWSPTLSGRRQESIDQVRATLAGLHDFAETDQKAVPAMAFDEYLQWIEDWSEGLAGLLWSLGAFTLGIGGLGLANIMFASVADRTREIGLRKAVGASQRAILAQFFAEAMVIVVLGGAVGFFTSLLAVEAIGSVPLLAPMLWDGAASAAGDGVSISLRISVDSLLTCTAVLLAVGLVAAMAPALKASRLDPVEALRHE
jgi:putative ABC transport system permease protein